ncbi:16S rRNA (guanine966-N2)-methyltransferase [Palleronia marisminoris]|uniref:Ribosomal RNA small subunit methyltransferase D n=1 Tax=Palleronia marisminoris TaxID=315423 RepID=A0A1Y5T219_9RHOB|nr:16S rRNA (guanine(966)-N(2))-methyltransferase RsmD [Palleronia marisminoris]SFH08542.1 16S rRNA (guanine966-N2)-methyltransferase [Palleronia marisminoris]SLN52253.1 Ribosomal RNA small subunit methyltransferase D [Palleronia marisminoris]
MRIIAGTHRGRALAAVGKGDPAAHLRPTTDRVRESLFGVLEGGRFGDPVEGAHVLDLFAGTGALGLEALSRGAADVTFVESGRKALALLSRNIETLGEAARTRILRQDAARLGPSDRPCDLVFLDPPYGKGLGQRAIAAARAGGWIAPGALIVWEEAAAVDLPEGLSPLETRRYGDTWISLARHEG